MNKKGVVFFLILMVCFMGCTSPIKYVDEGAIIKPAKVQKNDKFRHTLPGIKVDIPKDEIFSEDLTFASPITNKHIVRLEKEPKAKATLDAQLKREADGEIAKINSEFWTKVTLFNFLALATLYLLWQARKFYREWKKDRAAKEVNPFTAPKEEKKKEPKSNDQGSLHDNTESEF